MEAWLHQKFQFVHGFFGTHRIFFLVVQCLVVAAYDFLPGCFPAYFIVNNAFARHVHSHIRRRFIRAVAQNLLKHSAQDRKDLNIAVIVYGSFPIGFQMEGVYHIDIVQIGSSGLVGDIDRVAQWQVPDRESLKLGIASRNASLMFVV